MGPVVEVRALSKAYGETRVLRDVNLEIPRSSMSTLTGRSGSGKSTLFKLLAGLDRPDEGEIILDGRTLADRTDDEMSEIRLRRIGLVFQSFNLLPDLTVAENVRLPLDIAGVERRKARARASELLSIVGIERHAEKRPNLLSGGEAQRVAVARALANDPAILLADEPTGSLDTGNARMILDLFEQVNRELGTTVIIVTHDTLAIDRVPAQMVLTEGRVAWTRPPVISARARATD